jgi:hypothetical protein
MICDLLDGEGDHEVNQHWRLRPGLRWRQEQEVSFAPSEGMRIAIIPAVGAGWSRTTFLARHSEVYGRLEEADVLRFATRTRVPIALTSVLACSTSSAEEFGRLSELPPDSTETGIHVYRFDRSRETHLVVIAARHHDWQWRDLASDAEFFYYGIDCSGHELIACCSATRLSVRGAEVFSGHYRLPRWEWSNAEEVTAGGAFNLPADAAAVVALRALVAGKQIGAPG